MISKLAKALLGTLTVIALVLVISLLGRDAYELYDGIKHMKEQSSIQIAKDLPDFVKSEVFSRGDEKYKSLIRLYRNGEFSCSAAVISDSYAVTAAHCVVDDHFYIMTKEKMAIHDADDNDTGIEATAAALNGRTDFALIVGNFRNFQKVFIETDAVSLLKISPALIACGFPQGGKPLCVNMKLIRPYAFQFAVLGVLYPGMSGGPVFNSENKLVAVNSAATEDGFMLVSPLVEMFPCFKIKVVE